MALETLSTFDQALGRGIHGNKYKVLLTLPDGVAGDTRTFSLMVRAATVPSMITGEITTTYKGKTIKYAGDEAPEGTWDVTAFLEDGDTALTAKTMAEQWQKLATDSKKGSEYKSNATITIVSANSKETDLATWKIDGVWIMSSGNIALSDDTVDEITSLEMSFNYDNVIRTK